LAAGTLVKNMVRKAAEVVIVQDGMLLTLDRNFPPRGMDFPGGSMEPGETPEETAIRETKEETGVNIRITKSLGAIRWSDGEVKVVCYVFEAVITGGRVRGSREGRARFVPVHRIKLSMLAFKVNWPIVKWLQTSGQQRNLRPSFTRHKHEARP
jgi:8-oxo-dGTP pyrophosphatase MutT (NUDIX family)